MTLTLASLFEDRDCLVADELGFPHLTKLIESTTFPWLLSNIIDRNTNQTPAPLRKFWVTERCGVRIGVIALVEQ